MHYVSLNHFYDFIPVLNSLRNHPTKNECFYAYSIYYNLFIAQTEIKS
jgi:hypothetical protein